MRNDLLLRLERVFAQNTLGLLGKSTTPSSYFRGFLFMMFPLVRKALTHLKIVFRLGMLPRHPTLNSIRNALYPAINDSPFLTNASDTNTQCLTYHSAMMSVNCTNWQLEWNLPLASTPTTCRVLSVSKTSDPLCIIAKKQKTIFSPPL